MSLPQHPAHAPHQIAFPSAHGLLIANQQWALWVHHTIDPSSIHPILTPRLKDVDAMVSFSAHSISSSNSGKSSTTQHSLLYHTSCWALHLVSVTSPIQLWPWKWPDDYLEPVKKLSHGCPLKPSSKPDNEINEWGWFFGLRVRFLCPIYVILIIW